MIDLHIDKNWKKIGVRLSGGADSSILYYAMCYEFKDKPDVEIYPLTMDTNLKWWYSTGAEKVIDKVTELTGKKPAQWYKHWNEDFKIKYDLESYEKGINAMQRDAALLFNLDVVYIGMTKNPPADEFKTYFQENSHVHNIDYDTLIDYIESRDRSRDTQSDPCVMELSYDDKKVKQIIPFTNSDKKEVRNLYEHYGVLDTLYPITYSCEKVPELRTEPLAHCKHCFFCLERWWGFGRIV